jgi:hypothetical protein
MRKIYNQLKQKLIDSTCMNYSVYISICICVCIVAHLKNIAKISKMYHLTNILIEACSVNILAVTIWKILELMRYLDGFVMDICHSSFTSCFAIE